MGFVDEAKPAVFEALAIVGGVEKDAASGESDRPPRRPSRANGC